MQLKGKLFTIYGNLFFLMQRSMAMHKHICLECVGFLSEQFVQLCVHAFDKHQFSLGVHASLAHKFRSCSTHASVNETPGLDICLPVCEQ